jgi:hypothetical protein
MKMQYEFYSISRFLDIQLKISPVPVDSVLETLLVALYTIQISPQNFWNLTAKFGSKVEIC